MRRQIVQRPEFLHTRAERFGAVEKLLVAFLERSRTDGVGALARVRDREMRQLSGIVPIEGAVDDLGQPNAGNQAGGGRHHPSAHRRLIANHDTRGPWKRNYTGGTVERFEATGDLRLLSGETFRRKGAIRLDAQFVADSFNPGMVGLEPLAAGGTRRQMRMIETIGPQMDKGPVIKMSAAEAFKK